VEVEAILVSSFVSGSACGSKEEDEVREEEEDAGECERRVRRFGDDVLSVIAA
jgi:hypothetical protein